MSVTLTIGNKPLYTPEVQDNWVLRNNSRSSSWGTIDSQMRTLGLEDIIFWSHSGTTFPITWKDWRFVFRNVTRWWGDQPVFIRDEEDKEYYRFIKGFAKFLLWTMFKALLTCKHPVIEVN